MKRFLIKHVHESQNDKGEHSFSKKVKNVIDAIYYSKKAHDCYEWFSENQDVIAGLISTLWDAVRSLL